jgi:hypothetical protein
LESSFEGGLLLKFPDFTTKAIIGRDDIYLDFKTASSTNTFDVNAASSFQDMVTSTNFCRKISDFQEHLEHESDYLDYVLSQLHQYYTTVRTKRQLNFDLPAGFRKTSQHQQNTAYCRHLSKSPFANKLDHVTSLDESTIHDSESSPLDSLSNDTSFQNTILSSSTIHPPIIRSVDKPSSSLPRTVTVS